MRIQINAKQIHKKKQNVASYVWELPEQPDDLRGLIRMLVLSGVSEYNRRVNECQTPQPLSVSRMEDLGLVGKIGFGLPFDMREANPQDAVETALQGFRDGFFRVFIGDREIESLEEPLDLREGDTLTIIRLVMLTGGYF